MTWLYWLSQIAPTEQSLVGEKILILSQLLQAGYPIVPGFAVDCSLFTEFLSNLDDSQSWIDNFSESLLQLDLDNYQALQSLAQESQKTIMETEFPQLWQENILNAIAKLNCSQVIIRPSLIIPHSQLKISQSLLESQICGINPTAIVWGIKKVWSELFTAKSICYWYKSQIKLSSIKFALLIQQIQNVQASGTIILDRDSISIRAIWGLGHGLDYGAVQPDIYFLNREHSNLIEQQLGVKTIYYHLKNSLDSLAAGEDYLVTDVVEESLQERAVLNEQQVTTLVQLVEEIIREKPKLTYFEWSSPQGKHGELRENGKKSRQGRRGDQGDSQFYFNQVGFITPYSSNKIENLSATASPKVLLTGIAAAPGKVTGEVIIYNSEEHNHDQIATGSILVTNNIALSDISLLKNLGAIITETGSATSHAAIVARELGIPAIVNSKNATAILQTGQLVMVDGDQGKVYAGESVTSKKVELNISERENFTSLGIFDYPIGTKLMVNLSQDNMLDEVASLPIDGIGLLRADLMLLDLLNSQNFEQLSQENFSAQIIDYLVNAIKKFAIKFAPRPVFYRSLDISLSQLSSHISKDYTLDNRGTAAYLQDSSFFDLELSALARLITVGFTNINLILPFVRNLEEFIFCRDRFLAQGLGNSNACQLWMMAEVPSVIFLLPEYIKAGVQGVVIGTGDLTRLLFGLEREEIDLNKYYDSRALHNAIAQIISLTKNQQIPCSICLHGTDINPDLIDNLVNWGITNITVEPQAIRETYRAISRAEQRLLLAEITKQN